MMNAKGIILKEINVSFIVYFGLNTASELILFELTLYIATIWADE